jgi:DNA-directed RNA polymerase specialized sigma24 family protein
VKSNDNIRSRVVNFLVARGVPKDDAEDAVQEALIAEWRRSERHPESPILNRQQYLSTAAARRLPARPSVATLRLGDLDEEVLAAEDDGIRRVEVAQLVDQLLRRSRRRPGPLREAAIRRCILGGEDPCDLAKEIGASFGQIRTWLYRFRQDAAREIMAPPQAGEPGESCPSGAVTSGTFVMAPQRLATIAEIAGVSLELTRHYLLETEIPNADDHQRWLDQAPDQVIAEWLRSCLHSVVAPDDELGG